MEKGHKHGGVPKTGFCVYETASLCGKVFMTLGGIYVGSFVMRENIVSVGLGMYTEGLGVHLYTLSLFALAGGVSFSEHGLTAGCV